MTKTRQIGLLLEVLKLIAHARPWKDATTSYCWQVIKYAHARGYLYVGFNGASIDMAVIAYRIKEGADLGTIPESEDGDTLFVLLAVSKSGDRHKLNKLKHYYLLNNPDVKKIMFYSHLDKSDLRTYEVSCGRSVETKF